MQYTFCQEVQDRAAEQISSWERLRNSRNLAPLEALSLLATYAHLKRFNPTDLNQDEVDKFNRLVESETDNLVNLINRLEMPSNWINEAKSLSEAWDQPMTPEQGESRERQARKLFSQLDEYSLVLSALKFLRGEEIFHIKPLADWVAIVQQSEEFFGENPETFYAAAPLATSAFESYRPDVLFDHVLGSSTAKYRILQEMLEEEEALRS